MKGVFLLVPVLLSCVNFGSSLRRRSPSPPSSPAGHEKVIGNSVALVIGIPALIILVAIVLLKLKQSKTQDVQMQDLNFQNSGNDTAFVIGESRLEKRFVQLVRPASDFMAT